MPARPGGVTYACVLSIVLGAMACVAALFILAFASFFALIPFAGPALASVGFLIAIIPAAVGVLGIVAGAQGLQGASWARWTMVALFGVGALMGLTTLVIPALNILAIVMLVNQDAARWFEMHEARRVSVY